MEYTSVIGLEIHAELLTKSKIFCSCKNEFGNSPNSTICPICTGMPGILPSINKEAVNLAIKAGLCLDCKINNRSSFDRKNYFYPDLPKAYQITQFYNPICENGQVFVDDKVIGIERIHIEEDAGKLIHSETENYSLIDFNRCGVPLIEIVTDPDFETADEVIKFLEDIVLRLKYANVCDAKLEEGSLRVDVNISVKEKNSCENGTRAEIKNLNSYKSIKKAIIYETERQINLLNEGKDVCLETRRFDEKTQSTVSLRRKETTSDYRYFPDPDIPEIHIDDEEVSNIKKEMPLLPHIRYKKYLEEHKLSQQDARLIISDRHFSDFYENVCSNNINPKDAANFMLGELNRNLNKFKTTIKELPFSAKEFSELIIMQNDGLITKNTAKKVLELMFTENSSPMEIAKSNNILTNTDNDAIKKAVLDVISENEENVKSYKDGNEKLLAYFMGQVMRKTQSSANPQTIREILLDTLEK